MVLTALREEKEGRPIAQRYQLKDSLMQLGSAGFMFEDYVGELLSHSGFKIKKIRSKVRGECITHEIDLIAISENKKTLVECKYHSKRGVYTGLKESMYTHARFLDTQKTFDNELLICNTKVSNHAKKYAKCIGQEIISWRYPTHNSLEQIIEKDHLYPITILNLTSKELEIFSQYRIVLAKSMLDYTPSELSKKTKINMIRINNFQKLVRQIIA